MSAVTDPIVAIATAPGRGGIGVVRLSGADLSPVLAALLGEAAAAALRPRHATLAPLLAADGGVLDTAIVLLFPAPHSYTGQTVLELQVHGGPVLLQLLVQRCLEAGRALGLRLAQPGEFTQRAFLNDRLDLAQAEAVADLIDASTEAAARAAARSLTGVFSQRVTALMDTLTELRALVEATLDFPEEEIDFLEASDARVRLARVQADLAALRAEARQGALLRDGLHVVLVGAPNVGKSSLLNALAGEDVAIVSAVPGTTRDRIVQRIQIDGLALHVTDTAGLRATADEVERIGIARTLEAVARADVVLHLVDATDPGDDAEVLATVRQHAGRAVPVVHVANKVDLVRPPTAVILSAAKDLLGRDVPDEVLRCAQDDGEGAQDDREEAQDDREIQPSPIAISALTGAGLPALRAALARLAGWDATAGASTFAARQRHLDALGRADAHLQQAAAHAAAGDQALELLAEELRLAGVALGEIVGVVEADELLGVIFGRFCIGK